MTHQSVGLGLPPRRLGRGPVAVVLGLLAVVVLSLGTDQVLHVLKVYPPWGQPMYDSGLLGLALAYRCVYAVLGSYLAARLAPRRPMRHALVLGIVGLALSLVGLAATLITRALGPTWYPAALVLTALPCAWLGGVLEAKQAA